MSESYSRLYGMEQVGLRFFTVYGPWGRPDMAYWTFTRDIIEGRPIRVFNNGQLRRDFTWIDDIVAGVVSTAIDAPRTPNPALHRIYNIGNNRPVELGRFIEIVEDAVGKPRAKRSWSRCSPATSTRPTPTSMRWRATMALRRRRSWKRASPAS